MSWHCSPLPCCPWLIHRLAHYFVFNRPREPRAPCCLCQIVEEVEIFVTEAPTMSLMLSLTHLTGLLPVVQNGTTEQQGMDSYRPSPAPSFLSNDFLAPHPICFHPCHRHCQISNISLPLSPFPSLSRPYTRYAAIATGADLQDQSLLHLMTVFPHVSAVYVLIYFLLLL